MFAAVILTLMFMLARRREAIRDVAGEMERRRMLRTVLTGMACGVASWVAAAACVDVEMGPWFASVLVGIWRAVWYLAFWIWVGRGWKGRGVQGWGTIVWVAIENVVVILAAVAAWGKRVEAVVGRVASVVGGISLVGGALGVMGVVREARKWVKGRGKGEG